ncbi:hypothetical protein EBZ02_02070 [bacterium]|nr:hypothetical protein [bacterium]
MVRLFIWNPLICVTLLFLVVSAILVPLTLWSLRRSRTDTNNPNVMGWGLSLVGGSFIFISAFVSITVWEHERVHDQGLVKEFNAAVSLAEEVFRQTQKQKLNPAQGRQILDQLALYGSSVRTEELTRPTGLPEFPGARGSPQAAAALEQVELFLRTDEREEASDLRTAWGLLKSERVERLSMESSLPSPILGILVISALATLVMVGAFPCGGDVVMRWIMATACGIVVITIFVGVMLLLCPGSKQVTRQASVDLLDEVLLKMRR